MAGITHGERYGEGRDNTGLAGMVACPGRALFQKGQFPHTLNLPQGDRPYQASWIKGHS